MKVLVFPKVLHGGEIHSLDISRDNKFLATSGLDGVILIWDLKNFSDLNENPNYDTKKIKVIEPIKSLESQDGLTTVVKWSPADENKLVSGDINGTVRMYDISSNENRVVYPLNDEEKGVARVVDLSWSIDGRLVAWSSGEGKIHLFDATKNTYQELTSLPNLEKLNKQRSIAFDPTNNFLISMGDDTLIYLYQFIYQKDSDNYQFKLVSRISKLINKTSLNIDYKRISWSPDGEYVSVPTASKNQASVISLLSRSNDWDTSLSLVGHNLDCEVVKYNPLTFSYEEKSKSTGIYHIIATAGSDKTIVVWNTTKDSPLFILKDLCQRPLVDICWDKPGENLFAATLDGHIIMISFLKGELGHKVSEDVQSELWNIGISSIKPFNAKTNNESSQSGKKQNSSGHGDILDQKNAQLWSDRENREPSMKTLPAELKNESHPKETNIKENVAQSKDDTEPQLIPEVIGKPLKDDYLLNSDDILKSAMSSTRTSKSANKEQKEEKVETTKNPNLPANKTKITMQNGKKRIQPTLISSNNAGNVFGVDKNGEKPNSIQLSGSSNGGEHKTLMEFEKPSFSVSHQVYTSSKRQKSLEETGTKKLKRELEPVKFIGSALLNPNTTFSKLRLSVPKVRLNFQIASQLEIRNGEVSLLDIKNGSGNEVKPSRISYMRGDKQVWCDFIPSFIQLVTEGELFWAICTSDGQILTYSRTSGKRILPPLILGSPLSFLESHSNYLMAVTCIGELYVWDISSKKKVLHSPQSLASLLEIFNKYSEDGLSKSDNITFCSITSKGIPLVTLSNGAGYLFNKDLEVWQTISESWWAFGSHYWDSVGSEDSSVQSHSLFNRNKESSIVALLEHKTNEQIIRRNRSGRGKYFNKISKNMLMKKGFENLENIISLSHLENRILCCELLGEAKEFRSFFIAYAKRICELGLKAKLFDVCSDLLGPSHDKDSINNLSEDKSDDEWSSTVCGISKHDLLRETILSCAMNRECQRILVHFGEKIGILLE